MKIELSTRENLKDILNIINQAKLYMKENGINQWNEDYPKIESLENDILNKNSYVVKDNNKIIGTFVLIFGDEKSYQKIEGSWKTDLPYGTLHRVAIDNSYKGKGVASFILDFAENMAREKNIFSLRIDTHRDNISMRRFIEKSNFNFCGIIYVEDGTPRVAFEKILK